MPLCSLLQKNYQDLLALKEQFGVELKEATTSGDFTLLATLKKEIIEKQRSLESHLNPFESTLKIREQYETQKKIYENIGLLEKREGVLGMEGINKKWYPFPTLGEVHKRFREKKEMLDIKTDQGFTKLLIVPFGMSLAKFRETMKKTLRAHYAEMPDPANPGNMIPDPEKTRLFSKKANGTIEALFLDTECPLFIAHQWTDADVDVDGKIVYFPHVFEKVHGGKTKQDLLRETKQGFHILLIEVNPNIPSEGANEVIGTKQPRKRLEANSTPNQYLKTLQTEPEYSHEQGMTPEAWMTQFILQLEETNQVIDDWKGNGKMNFNLGGWFPVSGNVADGEWNSVDVQVALNKCGPEVQRSYRGSRSAVRI